MNQLDQKLRAAHETGNISELSALYDAAATAAHDEQAKRFYLTHAYVFALDAGLPEAEALRDRLIMLGAEPPAS